LDVPEQDSAPSCGDTFDFTIDSHLTFDVFYQWEDDDCLENSARWSNASPLTVEGHPMGRNIRSGQVETMVLHSYATVSKGACVGGWVAQIIGPPDGEEGNPFVAYTPGMPSLNLYRRFQTADPTSCPDVVLSVTSSGVGACIDRFGVEMSR
jgi:hypothetical protein